MQTLATMSHKMARPFKVFLKLHKSSLLIANLAKGAVSGLRQFGEMKALENWLKRFLYHLKSSFGSQDIQRFVLTFWSCRISGLISKRLLSKFMTSQCGKQTIKIHILPNISWSKGNQTIKCAQLIETHTSQVVASPASSL